MVDCMLGYQYNQPRWVIFRIYHIGIIKLFSFLFHGICMMALNLKTSGPFKILRRARFFKMSFNPFQNKYIVLLFPLCVVGKGTLTGQSFC